MSLSQEGIKVTAVSLGDSDQPFSSPKGGMESAAHEILSSGVGKGNTLQREIGDVGDFMGRLVVIGGVRQDGELSMAP